MDGRDLVRSVKARGRSAETARGADVARGTPGRRAPQGTGRDWWRGGFLGAWLPGPRRAERARVPGRLREAVPGPGGGVVRFARSELRIVVTVSGAVFWGWDGAGPEPSRVLAGRCPEPDERVALEPDKDGGWRVVAERVTVAVSRDGRIEVRTPGGVTLRRDLPPRWWEPVDGGPGRHWMQRSEVAPDARFFGLGGRASGPRLRDGTYLLGSVRRESGAVSGDRPLDLALPVQLVVADAASHLVFHDTGSDATVRLREGEEGAGSGHDRAGLCDMRSDGGPLRCWVMVGTPARLLRVWTSLTGTAPVPSVAPLAPVAPVAPVPEGATRAAAAGPVGTTEPKDPTVGPGLRRSGAAWPVEVSTGWAGLRASLSLALGLGLCGVPYSGAEAGGADARMRPELALRRLQLDAYLTVPDELTAPGPGVGESGTVRWSGGPEPEYARAVLAERRRLGPYFTTLARLARHTGAPVVRPVWWESPEDRALRDCGDAFLLGDSLLVAPALGPGTVRRSVRLPRGLWYDTATGEAYQGPGRVVVGAPLSRIPVLARAGSVIPVQDADGRLELEVWAPEPGRRGGGVVAPKADTGCAEPEVERYTAHRHGRRVVVERAGRENVGELPYPVRVRGLGRPGSQG